MVITIGVCCIKRTSTQAPHCDTLSNFSEQKRRLKEKRKEEEKAKKAQQIEQEAKMEAAKPKDDMEDIDPNVSNVLTSKRLK